MDSGPTFPHLPQGFKHDVGEGQWPGSMAIPCTCRKARAERRVPLRKAMRPCFPEKRHDTERQAVPKPTQVGGYKDTKARGRNLVKELGNMAP